MLFVTYALYHAYERCPAAGLWLSFLTIGLFIAAFLLSRRRDVVHMEKTHAT